MKKLWASAALAAAALVCVRPVIAQIGIVPVTGGRIEGVTADGITSFKDIPFAAPPVGQLRWRAPHPVRPWHGIRKADHFGPSCMQDPGMLKSFGAPPETSEDCLYLNVWTPAQHAGEKLPVMVWIYGGGFTSGTTSGTLYDGTHLAKKGVVLVSVAYRIGVLGCLADAELSAESPHDVSGNYGLLDVIAALEWVKSNIGRFGGDPSRVTIFGESSGGNIVSVLSVSPPARGLFQRAISESGDITGGGAVPSRRLAAAQTLGERFLAQLGAATVAAARALPAEALVKAQGRFAGASSVIDGYVLPDDEYELYQAGRFNGTPLLLGFNADEGRLIMPPGVTPKGFEAMMRASFGSHADAIIVLHPHATNAQAEQAGRDVAQDWLGWSAWSWAHLHSQKGPYKAFLYYFDRRSPQAPLGPTHAAEIGYVFGNLGTVRGSHLFSGPPGPVDVTLSQQIQSYWVNFAKTGDPNGPGLPRWPAFGPSSQRVMHLDAPPHAGPVPNVKQIKMFAAAIDSR